MSKPLTFEDTLIGKPDSVAALANKLRAVVVAELPDADENVYGGKVVQNVLYSFADPNNVLCALQPAKDKVLFYIHNIVEEDSRQLKLEGKGKSNRHVKLTELDGETEAELRRLLQLSKQRAG